MRMIAETGWLVGSVGLGVLGGLAAYILVDTIYRVMPSCV